MSKVGRAGIDVPLSLDDHRLIVVQGRNLVVYSLQILESFYLKFLLNGRFCVVGSLQRSVLGRGSTAIHAFQSLDICDPSA